MKVLHCLLASALSSIAFAAAPADSGTLPEGLTASEWSGIRAAHDAARHAVQREDDGDLVARNPGQQWSAEFDGTGFTVTPDHGTWTWGLVLTGYGDRTLSPAPSLLHHDGGKITCRRDDNLTEWFINDSRGLEQGWDLRQRPHRADPAAPLQLHLTTRGNVRPQVSASGDNVSFLQERGGSALTYGGLKAWDADGTKLTVRFAQAGGNGIRIVLDDRHARYPVTIDPLAQQPYLKASNPGLYDSFGDAVAISGDTVAVGAEWEASSAIGVNGDQSNNDFSSAGAVYIFTRSGSTWTQQAYIKASNTGSGQSFGSSVALSGDTLVVGSYSENSAATGVNGNQTSTAASRSGAAYIFTRSGTIWSQQAYLKASNTEANDNFGGTVAISGDTVVVGASSEDSGATGANGDQASNTTSSAGAAYVFTRTGTTWTQQAYLKASNTSSNLGFGGAVAISGDTVIVGAAGDKSSATGVNGDQTNTAASASGAAYVFTRTGTTWAQQAYLKASNTQSSDIFGTAVAISGDTAAVGAYGEDGASAGVNGDPTSNASYDSGAVYVFTRSGTTWSQQAYLKASNPDVEDGFGFALALSGDKLVVGARREDSAATGLDGDQTSNAALGAGAAYVFTRNGSAWAQQAYLKASNPDTNHGFGSSVAVSGDTVVAGAPGENSAISGVNGSQSPIYNYLPGAGAAYITIPPVTTIRAIPAAKDGLAGGGTYTFPTFLVGDTAEITLGVYHFGTTALNLTGTPAVALAGSSDFTVSAPPALQSLEWNGFTTFKVRFAPTVSGIQSVSLSIPHDNPAQDPVGVQLVGRGLSFADDTDGDGLNDASEFRMTDLNFNWELSQPALASAYLADVNRLQLYTPAQLQALHPGKTLAAKDPVTGRFKVTTKWQKSTNLVDFFNFPAPPDSSVSITPAGKIEFDFAAPSDKAAFFKIGPEVAP